MVKIVATICITICICIALVSSVDLSEQQLETIPWENIPDNDDHLILEYNNINRIDWVPTGKSIRFMEMQSNLLDEFPNFINISYTLTEIYLSDNQITHLAPIIRLTSLVELVFLSISDNPIVELQQVIYLPPKLERPSLGFDHFAQLGVHGQHQPRSTDTSG